jgi:hypothetical protein
MNNEEFEFENDLWEEQPEFVKQKADKDSFLLGAGLARIRLIEQVEKINKDKP